MKTFKKFAFVAIMMAGAAVSFTSCGGDSLFNEPGFMSTSPTGTSSALITMYATVVDDNKELSSNELRSLSLVLNDASTRTLNYTFTSQVRDAKDDIIKTIKNKMRTQLNMNASLKSTHVKVVYRITAMYSTGITRKANNFNGAVYFSNL